MWKVMRQLETTKIPGHGKTLNSEVGKDGASKANSRYLGWQHILEIDRWIGSLQVQSSRSPLLHRSPTSRPVSDIPLLLEGVVTWVWSE